MKKFVLFLVLVALLFIPTTSLASDEKADSGFSDVDINSMVEAMQELEYDSQLIEEVKTNLSKGKLPDVMNPEAEVVKEEDIVEGDTIITRHYYEDGTYEDTSIEFHEGIENFMPSNEEFATMSTGGHTRNVKITRQNINVYMEFQATITHVNQGNSFINRVWGQHQRSLTGTVAVNENLRIIDKYASGSRPALAGFAVQSNFLGGIPSISYKLGVEVIRSTYTRVTHY